MKLKGIRYCTSLEKYVYLEVTLKNGNKEEILGVVRDLNISKGFVTNGKVVIANIKNNGSITTPSNNYEICDMAEDETCGYYSLIGVADFFLPEECSGSINTSSYSLENLLDIIVENNISEGIILYNGEVHSIIEDDCLIESKLISILS